MVKIEVLNNNHSKEDLLKLSIDFFNEYQSHHYEFFDVTNIDPEYIYEYFRSFMGNKNKSAFVAVNNDKIIGYLTAYVKSQAPFYEISRIGDISGLMVDKAFRGRGIATKLLDRAKEFFAERSVKYYIVFTSVNNNSALELYKKCGMTELYTTMMGKT